MSAPQAKKQRNSVSIETKIKILDSLANGIKKRDVCKKFRVTHSTLRTIALNEATIRHSAVNGIDQANRKSCYAHDPLIEKMEKSLLIWIEDNNRKKIPLSGDIIKEKALRIYNLLYIEEPTLQKKKNFKPGMGGYTNLSNDILLKMLKRKAKVHLQMLKLRLCFQPNLPKSFKKVTIRQNKYSMLTNQLYSGSACLIRHILLKVVLAGSKALRNE